MEQKKQSNIANDDIDELVNYIDKFMSSENGGHINVKINEVGKLNKDEVLIDKSTDCCNTACKAPTLFEGLDNNDEEE